MLIVCIAISLVCLASSYLFLKEGRKEQLEYPVSSPKLLDDNTMKTVGTARYGIVLTTKGKKADHDGYFLLKSNDAYTKRSVDIVLPPALTVEGRRQVAEDLMKSSEIYLLYVNPWVEGLLTIEELAASGKVKFVPVKTKSK